MAKATLIPPTPPMATIQLDLSMDEAETLRSVLAHVGGDIVNSRRKYTDRISAALSIANVSWHDMDIQGFTRFTNTKE